MEMMIICLRSLNRKAVNHWPTSPLIIFNPATLMDSNFGKFLNPYFSYTSVLELLAWNA